MGHGQGTNQLDFGGDLITHSLILPRFLYVPLLQRSIGQIIKSLASFSRCP